MTCAEVDDSAPGYALDILDPGRRQSVASHLLRCGRCRETVSRTQESADRLLDIGADRADPELMNTEPLPDDWFVDAETDAVRPPRRRLRAAATMAAVMVLVVGTTLGPEIEQATRSVPKPTLAVPLMTAAGTVGSVRIYPGQPPVVQVDVTDLPGSGTLRADLVDAAGRVESLGQFRLAGGRAGWASTEPRDMTHPKSLILADSAGRVLASAALS